MAQRRSSAVSANLNAAPGVDVHLFLVPRFDANRHDVEIRLQADPTIEGAGRFPAGTFDRHRERPRRRCAELAEPGTAGAKRRSNHGFLLWTLWQMLTLLRDDARFP